MKTISRYAIVIAGAVDNVICWDGDTVTWSPPADAIMVKLTDQPCDIGWSYAGAGIFTQPAPDASEGNG